MFINKIKSSHLVVCSVPVACKALSCLLKLNLFATGCSFRISRFVKNFFMAKLSTIHVVLHLVKLYQNASPIF